GPAPLDPYLGPTSMILGAGIGPSPVVPWSSLRFLFIGHCLISLAIATVGGLLALALAARREAARIPAGQADRASLPHPEANPHHPIFTTPGRAIPGSHS